MGELLLTSLAALINMSAHIIELSGIFFDHVEELSEYIPESFEQAKFLPVVDIVSRLNNYSSTGYDRLEVFMRTLLADKIDEGGTDTNKEHFPIDEVSTSYIAWLQLQMAKSIIVGSQVAGTWISDPTFMKFRDLSLVESDELNFDAFLAEYMSLFDPDKQNQTEEFTNRFIKPTLLFASMYDKSIWIRRLARTRRTNLLCLAAPSVEPGDQIWFLRGGKVPFILHGLPNGNFLLRGEAYVHGNMDGEIFSNGEFSTGDAREVRIE